MYKRVSLPKRRLFIGASGPIGYDYEPSVASDIGPVPVMEDLNGILLCYDELIFLAREFCPADMWGLPYVRFANEDVSAADVERLHVAAEQFRPPPGSLDHHSKTTLGEVVARVAGDEGLIDNHSRDVRLAPEWSVMGNAGELNLLIADMGMAAALELPRLDVLNNTIGAERVASQIEHDATFLGSEFGPWHISVAQSLATLRIPNIYANGKSYVEEIEDLRAHPNLAAFREMLSATVPTVDEASEAAAEISEMAHQFARRYISFLFPDGDAAWA